jgi:putative spermidine/putrescine transport system ATP-binding protein
VEQPLAARNHLGALIARLVAHLSLASLSKTYGETVAVADLSLDVEKGESVALLGPSGCGKTTTLRMVAGLIQPTGGRISITGCDITETPAHRRNMGYVFQSYALFPHMSVAANVGFGLDERSVGRGERDRRVGLALEQVRLTGLAGRKPRELSGGQQQRVALARALVIEPDVLLLDESLSNLDAKLRDAMRIEIRDLQRALGITTLFVTHDQTEALTLCDRVAVMNAGRIEQVADPRTIYDRPATRFVAEFVGRSSILRAARTGSGGLSLGGTPVTVVGALPDGVAVDVFVRPQRIALEAADAPTAPTRNRLAGMVHSTVFIGDRQEVLVDTPAGRVIVETASGGTVPAKGEAVSLSWAVEDTLVFAGAAA